MKRSSDGVMQALLDAQPRPRLELPSISDSQTAIPLRRMPMVRCGINPLLSSIATAVATTLAITWLIG